MGWSGGTYTKGNNATGGWAGDASLGIGIEASRHDTQDNDFATGINACLVKDGTNSMTANLNFGGYLPANVGAGTAAAPAFCAGNDVNTGAFGPAADTYAISTGGTERLRVNSSGQVGVGTTSPGVFVDLQSTSSLVNQTQFSANANGAELNLRKSRGASVGTNTIVVNGDTAGVIQFYGANGTGYDRCAYIGAIINGVPGATTDMPGAIVFGTTPDGSSTTSERMRIDKDGYVSLGTTDVYNNARLNAVSSVASAACVFANHTGSSMQSTPGLVVAKADNTSTTSQVFVQFLINARSTGSGQINANGASQAAFGSYSDARLKENIVDLNSQLANLLSLRPVEFDYKDGSGHQVGFIAQEVQQIYPDLVGVGADGFLTLTGLGKNEARLIKALQEAWVYIQGLEDRIEALEA